MKRGTAIRFFLIAALTVAVGFQASNAQVTVQDDITANTTWTSDNVYLLDGLIFVDSLVTLTIEPGTVIKGLEQSSITTGDGASALIVRRGATLNAVGTVTSPIIFTSELDDVSNPNDLDQRDRGLWGGVILLGSASNNEPTLNTQIEGIPTELNALYGGVNDDDSSGHLEFVSIRHGGFSISGVEGDEINGLTFGSVGRNTIVDHIEVFANGDDCYEWFGGTVQARHLVGAFCSDDSFDYDQGFRGKGQFWFSIHDTDIAGRGGEHDGGDSAGDAAMPFSIPVISNVTYIGAGATATVAGGDNNDQTFAIRDNAGGKYYNSIFTDFPGGAMEIEDKGVGSSRERLEMGDLVFQTNLFFGYGAGATLADIVAGDFAESILSGANNTVADPMLAGISRTMDGGLDPRPTAGSAALTSSFDVGDEWFESTDYLGAFGTRNWMGSWTTLDQNGYLGNLIAAAGEVTVRDDITTDVTWTSDNVYLLDGLVFVDSLATLTIDAGTVIKGLEDLNITTGEGASALVVRRGGKIEAVGGPSSPIIFTSELDDVSDPDDLDQRDRGLWGGVILLGSATNNEPTMNTQIEGIPTELNALYGGTNDDDDSGTLTYVSIRHGGFSISGVEGDEINGLTFGSVGRNTVIDHVEVFANGDDCFEWFGGTVQARHLVGAFCSDDSFDYDQGFRGKGQYWFSIHDTDIAGRAGEHDGGDSAGDAAMPFSIPVISNVTYVGSGATATVSGGDNNDQAFAIRDNAGGKYYNSIFTDFPGGAMEIEDKGVGSSRERLEMGDLVFQTNVFYGFGAGATLDAIVAGDFAESILTAANNTIGDPMLAGISRAADGGLDPRLTVGSAARTSAFDIGDSWFDVTPYLGAFGDSNWMTGWTTLDMNGYLGDLTVGVEVVSGDAPMSVSLSQNYPNPFTGTTSIEFDLVDQADVELAVYDLLGRSVEVLVDGIRPAGHYRATFDASGLSAGVYIYRLKVGSQSLTRTLSVMK